MANAEVRDNEWARIAELPEADRQAVMRREVEELAKLSEEERRARLRAGAEQEFRLPDDKLRAVIVSRIHVWLDGDQATVRPVAASLDAVMNVAPSTVAMRRAAIIQTLARDFPANQQERLRSLVPGAFPNHDVRPVSMASSRASLNEAAPKVEAARKPFWKFW